MASKSRRKNKKFHWTKELIFLIAGIVVLIVVAIIVNLPTAQNKLLSELNTAIATYNSNNSTEYSQLSEDTQCYRYISLDELAKKKKNNGYTYVLYGALDNGTTLQNLSAIASKVYDNDYVQTVYLMTADFVIAANSDKNAYDETYEYHEKIEAMERKINDNVADSGEAGLKTSYDIDLEKYPALLVFKNDQLIFNSQAYEADSTQYSWSNYISKAFSYQISEEADVKNVTPTTTDSKA